MEMIKLIRISNLKYFILLAFMSLCLNFIGQNIKINKDTISIGNHQLILNKNDDEKRNIGSFFINVFGKKGKFIKKQNQPSIFLYEKKGIVLNSYAMSSNIPNLQKFKKAEIPSITISFIDTTYLNEYYYVKNFNINKFTYEVLIEDQLINGNTTFDDIYNNSSFNCCLDDAFDINKLLVEKKFLSIEKDSFSFVFRFIDKKLFSLEIFNPR